MKYIAKKTEFIGSKFVSDRAQAEFDRTSDLGKFLIDSTSRFAKAAGEKTLQAYVDGKKADFNSLLSLYDNAPSEFQVREVADKLDTDFLLVTICIED